MNRILEIKNLSKNFGKIKAVQNLSLNIFPGQVFGILGPNGSGKTTTLGMILDVVAPTEGSFQWFDKMPNVEARKKLVLYWKPLVFCLISQQYKILKL